MQFQNPVRFLQSNEEISTFVSNQAYSVNRDKGMLWLQNICVGVLEWLGCGAVTKDVSYTPITITHEDISDAMHYIMNHDGMSSLMRNGGGVVLMGPREAQDLLHLPLSVGVISHEFEYKQTTGTLRYLVLGMRLVVIPWMVGLVVVPKSKMLKPERLET